MTTPPPGGPQQPGAAGAHMVRCPKHGRVYDASTEPGCSKCIAEGTTPDAGAKGADIPAEKRGLPTWILVLVLLGVAGAFIGPRFIKKTPGAPAKKAQPVARAGAGGEDDISNGEPRSDRLDPAPFRAPIAALEAALYEGGQRSPYTATRSVKDAAKALEDSVRAKHPGAPVPDFTRALDSTTARLEASSEAGYVLPDFFAARGNWERIRKEYFDNARWYHAPMAVSDVGVGEGGAEAGAHEDPAAFHQANAFADDLERIIGAYQDRVMAQAEPVPAPPPIRRGRRLIRRPAPPPPAAYTDVARRFNAELDRAQALGPSHWFSVDPSQAAKYARARGALSRALATLRAAVPAAQVKPQAVRRTALDSALADVRTGRAALAAGP